MAARKTTLYNALSARCVSDTNDLVRKKVWDSIEHTTMAAVHHYEKWHTVPRRINNRLTPTWWEIPRE